MITIEEAFDHIENNVQSLQPELVDLPHAAGRVLAEEVCSDVDAPPHHKSVMDGFALRSSDLTSGHQLFQIAETIVAGAVPSKKLQAGQAARIMTGAPLPDGADAVIMVEQTEVMAEQPDQVKFLVETVPPGKHVMPKAATLAVGDQVFHSGRRIRPIDIGLLAEAGAAQVSVFGLPTIACLPTGDELVEAREKPGPGKIRNSNGPMLAAMARGLGLQPVELGIGRDDEKELTEKIEVGLGHDLLVLSGGVSAGMLDLVPGILARLGVQQVFHKVRVKPGKPIWFGVLERGDRSPTYVFGLPGNPVSSLVGFQLFVRTAIRKLMGEPFVRPQSVAATLASPHQTRGDRPTYWPGQLVVNQEVERAVQPLQWLGSSDLRALGQADSLIYFSADQHEHVAGERVDVFMI